MKLKDWPLLPLAMIALMVAVGLYMYPHLPAEIPKHWNVRGEIDRWAPSTPGNVFSEPIIAAGLYVLFMLMPYVDPKRGNVYRSKSVYFLALDLVVGLITLTFFATILAAFDSSLPVDRVIMAGVGLMLAVLGNYMGRVKRNWTVGVRFGWTLSDDTVWAKTNRLGGRLFVAAGALTLAGAFLPPPWNAVIVLGSVLAVLPITYVYSMRLYKKLHPEEMEAPEPLGDDKLGVE